MKVLKSTCSYKHYEVQNAKVEGTDPEFGADWSFSFSYANGSAAVYAWVVLEGVEDEVELVLDERSGLTDTVDKVYTELSKNVLKQAAHVRGQLPDAIASWRANNPSLEDRLSLDNVKVKAEDSDGVAVVADLLVDGEKVYEVLEWLDDDGDLVRDDRHLDVNPYHVDAVEQALWGVKYVDFRDRVSVRVNELLEAALAQLPTPPEGPQGGDEGDPVEDESELLIAEIREALLPAPAPGSGATVAKPSKYPSAEISVDELPRELADEVFDDTHEAVKVAEFESPLLGRDEPETCVAYVLLTHSTSRAGVVVGNGSASWYDADTVDEALDAYLAECAAVAADFADREAA